MTPHKFMRVRKYSFHEILEFAAFFADNRNAAPPDQLLSDFLGFKNSDRISDDALEIVHVIELAAAKYYDLPVVAIRSKRRYAELVRARMVICKIAVKFVTQQNIAVGMFGYNRNNVQYNKTKCSELMETEPLLVREVETIYDRVKPIIDRIKNRPVPSPVDSIDNSQITNEQ
jgi:chromosomal replication initiation ATPase DnaA